MRLGRSARFYEEDFLGFSYGFRPGRGQHDALDALCVGISGTKVNHILDADIRSFFDEVCQEWLIKFLQHRIADPRLLRLIQKWLKAGILADGKVEVSDRGTPQGAVISPLLANVYLHYAFDLCLPRLHRFTFVCGKSLRGRFLLLRLTRRDRMVAKLKAVKEELRRRRHQPIPVQGAWLAQVVSGFFNYHAVPTNARALSAFRDRVVELWRRSLRRRSQRDFTTWERMRKLASDWLPRPRILHPWPSERFAVKHPRWEPSARIGPARFCAGGAQ